VFLCSDAAAAITGLTLESDQGWASAGITGAFPPAAQMAKFLTGRMSMEELLGQPPDTGP
jgi:hypothetical protein